MAVTRGKHTQSTHMAIVQNTFILQKNKTFILQNIRPVSRPSDSTYHYVVNMKNVEEYGAEESTPDHRRDNYGLADGDMLYNNNKEETPKTTMIADKGKQTQTCLRKGQC